MAKAKDKRLMLDLLRYPATVYYRDEDLLVLIPQTPQAFQHYTDGQVKMPSGAMAPADLGTLHIVETFRDDIFVIQIQQWQYEKRAYFYAYDHTGKLSHHDLRHFTDRNPSLFKAFGDIARKHTFLPLIEDQTDQIINDAMKQDASNVAHIRNLTHKRKMKLIEQYPDVIKSIEQTHELAMHAIEKHGGAVLRNIGLQHRTAKICLKAVSSYALAITDVPQELQTEALCLEAVKRDAAALGYIKNPSLAVCIAAVNKSPDAAWKVIKDPKLRKAIEKQRHQKRFR